MDALEAAISISIESGYLAKYLTEHREEVVTMMAELFDEERLRAEDDDAVRAEGRAEGIISTLATLVKEGILTIADAANRANMSVDDFKAKSGLTV